MISRVCFIKRYLTRHRKNSKLTKAIFCFSYLGLIPTFTPMIAKAYNMNNISAMLWASFAASTVAIIFSHPFDTIKTNLQGDIGNLIRETKIQKHAGCVSVF